MKKYIFICDESGAKGYSDNSEKHLAELGVLAGFIISNENSEKLISELDSVKNKFLSTGKLHITNLNPADQEKLRNEIFGLFKSKRIACVYEAIHVEGFHDYNKSGNHLRKNLTKQLRSKKQTSRHSIKESLHEELFQGAFGKAVAVCIDHFHSGDIFHLEVITDRIDKKISAQFENAAKKLLSFDVERPTRKMTEYNQERKSVQTGSVNVTIEDPTDLLGDLSKITFAIKTEMSGLTLSADVIVNSLYYFFKNRKQENKGSSLNASESIKGHPLEAIFLGLDDLNTNSFSDAIFMHPINIPDKKA